ncbi:Protein of unknown function [Pyronema omphalodes CBS 100304]|uniref:Uncharacterized protein n=1 Tax=Pyronema omphalodes (strain CBS 100304) TaxID=1076935 RepID=U4L3X7_PYROM|nr:Protein of unknown function [Pyronema omphalodes CBS 100304]
MVSYVEEKTHISIFNPTLLLFRLSPVTLTRQHLNITMQK